MSNLNEEEKINKIYEVFRKNFSISVDSRKIKRGDIFFAFSGDNVDGNKFAKNALESGAKLAIIDNKDIFENLKNDFRERIIFVSNVLKMLQELAKRYREDLKIPFLGITGSNGKTTTKELVREVLSKKYNVLATSGNFNNHIGVPLTILSIKPEHDFAIIEMGANHVGEIKELSDIAKQEYGIITNIGVAHIGEFGDFDNIIKTKKELYNEVLRNNGKIFLNKEDRILVNISGDFKDENIVPYLKSELVDFKEFLNLKINNNLIKTNLVGGYNKNNVEAAYIVGIFFEISEKDIIKAIEKYVPANNRSEFESSSKNNNIVWDCYNANPSSMTLALKSFSSSYKNGNYYVLGHMGELGKYSKEEHLKILKLLKKMCGKKILLGGEFKKIKKNVENDSDFVFVDTLGEIENIFKKDNLNNKNILVKGSNALKLFNLKNKNLI